MNRKKENKQLRRLLMECAEGDASPFMCAHYRQQTALYAKAIGRAFQELSACGGHPELLALLAEVIQCGNTAERFATEVRTSSTMVN